MSKRKECQLNAQGIENNVVRKQSIPVGSRRNNFCIRREEHFKLQEHNPTQRRAVVAQEHKAPDRRWKK